MRGNETGMERRDFLKVIATTGAGLALSTGLQFPKRMASAAAVSATPSSSILAATSAPCRWGAYVNPFGQSQSTGITAFETLIGRPLAITRHYLTWNIPLPGSTIRWTASAGHIPYVAWHATKKGNVAVPWASITAGVEDAWITTQAVAIRDAGFPMYLTFHHEPEDDQANGSAADFVAAYDHVRGIFDANGVTNVTWVVTLMATTYGGGHGGYDQWLPANFDLLGVDGYNRHPCIANLAKHPWNPFEVIFADAHDASVSSGIPLIVGENGCVEAYDCGDTTGDPAAKAQWIADEGTTLKSWPEVKAILYSHTTCRHNGFPMEYRVDSSPSSLAAYTALGMDPYFYPTL
jgi:hypothetical protein